MISQILSQLHVAVKNIFSPTIKVQLLQNLDLEMLEFDLNAWIPSKSRT